jgi:hypothetical protein
LGKLKEKAVSGLTILEGIRNEKLTRYKEKADKILNSKGPLALVEKELKLKGYGGDIRPALITYLAMTSRLIKLRSGAMPVHLLLKGMSSIGKAIPY